MTTVDSAEQLDALPEHTLIRDADGHFWVAINEPIGRLWGTVGLDIEETSESVVAGVMYGGGPFRVLAMPLPELCATAWDQGHSWGWSDSQEAHDVRQLMDRSEWRLSTPNPYRNDTEGTADG